MSTFKTIKPTSVRVSQADLVSVGQGLDSFPLGLRAGVDDISLIDWVGNNREKIESLLCKHGALLFRDFKVDSIQSLADFAGALSSSLIEYGERSSPRTRLSGGVYTSTDHPADQNILLHNEQSYTLNWPMRIWFLCVIPAASGGRTPIADSRKILKRLDPDLVQKFTAKKIMYVRNYGDLGLSWQEAFQTDDKRVVEQYCHHAQIEVEWKEKDRLRTRQLRPAVRKHPVTGDLVWFNHAVFFHISSLQSQARESMLSVIDEDDAPFNTFYGDGSAIEDSELDAIRRAYQDETRSFTWQKNDILMLDNMLTAHGREAYEGPRKIVVAMAEPFGGVESV